MDFLIIYDLLEATGYNEYFHSYIVDIIDGNILLNYVPFYKKVIFKILNKCRICSYIKRQYLIYDNSDATQFNKHFLVCVIRSLQVVDIIAGKV